MLTERLGIEGELHPGEAALLAVTVAASDLKVVVTRHLSSHDLTQAEYTILLLLRAAGDSGLRLATVADDLRIKSREMTAIVQRLEEEGWVDRTRYAPDRRYVVHHLTESGLEKVNTIEGLDELYERILTKLGADEFAVVASMCDHLVWAAGDLEAGTKGVLRSHGLSASQFEILRMLRCAGPDGLRSTEIAEGLTTVSPDLRRALQGLRQRGWITMARDCGDARVVFHRLTRSGTEKLAALKAPLAERHDAIREVMGDGKVKQVVAVCRDVIKASEHIRARAQERG